MFRVTLRSLGYFKGDITSITLFGAMVNALVCIMGDNEADRIYNGDSQLIVTAPKFKGTVIEETITRKSSVLESGRFNIDLKSTGADIVFYVKTTYSIEEIKHILEIVLVNGIGGMRSQGYGRFSLVTISEVSEELLGTGGTVYRVLGDYIPADGESIDGKFTPYIFRGKDAYGVDKEPVYAIKAGAVFRDTENISGNVVGRIIRDKNTGALISGQSLIKWAV